MINYILIHFTVSNVPSKFIIFIFRSLKKITRCSIIIVIAYAVIGESMICDRCTCKNSIINCTETGQIDALNLWDHSDVLENAVLMHFDYNDIEYVKQLPPSKVKYLSLQHNKIKKIDDAAFEHLNYLVELDLSYNCLTTDRLNANVFKVYLNGFYKNYVITHYELLLCCVLLCFRPNKMNLLVTWFI